jgi:hypothetical protein
MGHELDFKWRHRVYRENNINNCSEKLCYNVINKEPVQKKSLSRDHLKKNTFHNKDDYYLLLSFRVIGKLRHLSSQCWFSQKVKILRPSLI